MHLAANNSTSATPRCQDALFFFVMKRRCHESLTHQGKCVHHATLLGPTFSKMVSLTACAETDCWPFCCMDHKLVVVAVVRQAQSRGETATSFCNCSQTSLLQLRVCQDVNYDHFLFLHTCDFRKHAWNTETRTMDDDRSDTSPVRTATAPWRINNFSSFAVACWCKHANV